MQALFFYQNEMTLVPKCLVKTPSSDKLLLDPFTQVKDLCRYGRNTQICQLQGKTPIALLKPIFFVNILSYAYKTLRHDPI